MVKKGRRKELNEEGKKGRGEAGKEKMIERDGAIV